MLKLKIAIPSRLVSKKLKPAIAKALESALPQMQAFALEALSTAADSALSSHSADVYKGGLLQKGSTKKGSVSFSVSLKGALPLALENGYAAFDIKTAMLAHGKVGKNGSRYVDVPFQHKRSELPISVARASDRLLARKRVALAASGNAAASMKVRMPGKTVGAEHERTLVFGDKLVASKVQHKQGIHDNVIRTAIAGSRSKYQTIRRISEKSDPKAWWHPGFVGVHLFDKVTPKVRREAIKILVSAFSAAGLEVTL